MAGCRSSAATSACWSKHRRLPGPVERCRLPPAPACLAGRDPPARATRWKYAVTKPPVHEMMSHRSALRFRRFVFLLPLLTAMQRTSSACLASPCRDRICRHFRRHGEPNIERLASIRIPERRDALPCIGIRAGVRGVSAAQAPFGFVSARRWPAASLRPSSGRDGWRRCASRASRLILRASSPIWQAVHQAVLSLNTVTHEPFLKNIRTCLISTRSRNDKNLAFGIRSPAEGVAMIRSYSTLGHNYSGKGKVK